jgi:hypothetical protein
MVFGKKKKPSFEENKENLKKAAQKHNQKTPAQKKAARKWGKKK